MDMECIFTLMEHFIKEIGLMVKNMGKGDILTLVEYLISEIGIMIKKTAKGDNHVMVD